ncbi:MAG: hypothetical protein RDU14_04840 [Melioribacteraceae bacterium]|nr:hypothetical protein [Melioribacteraceae bacterium]
MESPEQKGKINNISFYVLMTLLGLSVALSLGYLVYAILFG